MKMMMLFFLGLVYASNILGQGLNNEIDIDQTDLKVIFEELGFEVFKFSFEGPIENRVNLMLEEYVDGELRTSVNMYEDFLPLFSMLDEPLDKYFPTLQDDANEFNRIYFHTKDTLLNVLLKKTSISKKVPLQLDEITMTGTRGFDDIPSTLTQKVPLVVFYGIKEGELLSCPGDALPKHIATLYDYVVVVYASPFTSE